MAKAKKKVARSSKIKKKWYKIVAPKVYHEQVIGESFLGDASKAIGRTVPANLSNLTGDMRQQNTTLKFKINTVTDDKLYTELVGYDVANASMKRLVRRNRDTINIKLK